MFTPNFIRDSGERALATFAQTLIALVGTDAANVLEVGITDSLKAAAVAGALSIVKSIAAAKGPIGDSSASLADLGKDD